MISDLFYRKKLGVPYISIILVFSCLLVSISTYLSPRLFFVFGSSFQGYDATYPWQNLFTSQFEHGTFYVELGLTQGLPLLVHLFGNIIIIGVFGSIIERVVGAGRFLLLTIISASVIYFVRATIDSWGNGISGIAWAFGPIVFFIIFRLHKLFGKMIIKDLFFYISLILFFLMWILIPFGSEWTTNLFHFTSTLLGIVFVIVCKKIIYKKIHRVMIQSENIAINTNRWLLISVLAVPVYLVIVLILALMYKI